MFNFTKLFEAILHTINEDASGLQYAVPADELQRLYDFYFLTMHLESTDDLIEYELNHAREKLYNAVKSDLLYNISFAIYSEIFHAFNSSEYMRDAMSENESEVDELNDWVKSINPKLVKYLYTTFNTMEIDDTLDKYKSRNTIIRHALSKYSVAEIDFIKFCQLGFLISYIWPIEREGTYGGKNWKIIADGWLKLNDAKFNYADSGKEMSIWIDHAFDLQHNNGSALDKLEDYELIYDALEFKKRAISAKDFFKKISQPLIDYYKKLHFVKNREILSTTRTAADEKNVIMTIKKYPAYILDIDAPTEEMMLLAVERRPILLFDLISDEIATPAVLAYVKKNYPTAYTNVMKRVK